MDLVKLSFDLVSFFLIVECFFFISFLTSHPFFVFQAKTALNQQFILKVSTLGEMLVLMLCLFHVLDERFPCLQLVSIHVTGGQLQSRMSTQLVE